MGFGQRDGSSAGALLDRSGSWERCLDGMALAAIYTASGLVHDLQVAHDDLDHEVDRAFGLRRSDLSELERQDLLFERYDAMTAGVLTSKTRRRRR